MMPGDNSLYFPPSSWVTALDWALSCQHRLQAEAGDLQAGVMAPGRPRLEVE